MTADELLRELGELATSLGPAVRPAGTDELLRAMAETARRLFGAALRGFERRGWIELRERSIRVKQAAALGRFAGTEVSGS
jgi:hypothetical protein